MMRVGFKPYRRKDGSLMLYLNGSNKVSLGLSERGVATSKLTVGERNVYDAAFRIFNQQAQPFAGDMSRHAEEQAPCGNYILAITDCATIGGLEVGEDGAHLVRDGKILRCDFYTEMEAEEQS